MDAAATVILHDSFKHTIAIWRHVLVKCISLESKGRVNPNCVPFVNHRYSYLPLCSASFATLWNAVLSGNFWCFVAEKLVKWWFYELKLLVSFIYW